MFNNNSDNDLMDDESRIELPRALDFKRLDFVVFNYNEGFEVRGREIIILLVDIVGIVDHHCLNSLFKTYITSCICFYKYF